MKKASVITLLALFILSCTSSCEKESIDSFTEKENLEKANTFLP